MKKIYVVLLMFYACHTQTELPSPYNQIEVLPFHLLDGFLNPANARMLQLFAQSNLEEFVTTRKFIPDTKPKIVFELGSWLGTSAIHTATYLPGGSKLYAIDHWRGSLEHQNRPDLTAQLSVLYQQFLSNVIHKDLTDVIIPIRKTTNEAAQFINFKADIIYIDASHEENDVYRDIMNWYPKLNKNGILCGDDWGWTKNHKPPFPVQRAVKRAAKELNVEIKIEGNWFWYFLPKK